MSSPRTDTEVQTFQAAVESIGLETDTLLEHLPPKEVLAALFYAAVDVAIENRVGPSALLMLLGQVLANVLDCPLAVSVRVADDPEKND